MTKEEEVQLKEKFSEDDFSFIAMLMNHAQEHCDSVRKQLEEAREKDRERIKEMEKDLQEMIDENEEVSWAIDIAKAQLRPEVFCVLWRVMRNSVKWRACCIAEATNALRKERAWVNNCYKSLS